MFSEHLNVSSLMIDKLLAQNQFVSSESRAVTRRLAELANALLNSLLGDLTAVN